MRPEDLNCVHRRARWFAGEVPGRAHRAGVSVAPGRVCGSAPPAGEQLIGRSCSDLSLIAGSVVGREVPKSPINPRLHEAVERYLAYHAARAPGRRQAWEAGYSDRDCHTDRCRGHRPGR